MHHQHTEQNITQWLSLAFWMNLGFSIIELVGGLITNSTAIIADAFHDFLDAVAIGWAVLLEKYSKKKATTHFTYGYRRFSVLSAVIMSVILIVGGVLMIISAIKSFFEPKVVNSVGMLLLAILGIVINGFAFLRIKKWWDWHDHSHAGHSHSHDNNTKAVMLHLLEDVLWWVAVLFGSIVMYVTDRYWIDGVLTILIAGYILYNATKNLISTANIFLQSTPEYVSVDLLSQNIKDLTRVKDVHDIHVWSLDGSYTIGSLHLIVEKNLTKSQRKTIIDMMKQHHIDHPTIQIEFSDGECTGIECEDLIINHSKNGTAMKKSGKQ